MRRRNFLSLCGLNTPAIGRLATAPGSNLTYVEAPDLAALACLQNRLNGLGQDLAIEIRIG